MNIVIVGEAWGREEADAGAPFVGASGKILNSMLRQVGIDRNQCFVTNVFNFQPRGPFGDNDLKNLCGDKAGGVPGLPALVKGKYLKAEYAGELERLFREIRNEGPNLIIALGATAVWALTQDIGIKKVRGAPAQLHPSVAAKIGKQVKVLPTYHPAAVMREWSLRPIAIADLTKARRESEFPELRRPNREIWIEPNLDDMERFELEHIVGARRLSVDIETAGRQITCIGFAPSRSVGLVVPIVDSTRSDGNYWRTLAEELLAWKLIRKWCALPISYVGQNFLYDMNFLWTEYGICFPNALDIDDTMLAHHALQPEMEKGLGFLATVHTEELPWKFMRTKHETIKKED